jgi:hypothetical protein
LIEAMGAKPELKDSDRVLVVEGYSDLHFYAELLEHLGFKNGEVFIKQFNGKTDMKKQLEAFITPQLLAEKRAIGVAVDADKNAFGTFQSFQSTLQTLTDQIVVESGAWTEGQLRIGLFVAPDAKSEGEIETLVWRAWSSDPSNEQASKCIDTYVQCMEKAGHVAKSPAKAFVSTLLAIKNDEDPRLGPGAQARVFDFNRPEFGALSSFLKGFRL